MDKVRRARYEVLVRVSAFGSGHAELFPADSLGARTFAALEGTLRELRDHMVMSDVVARDGLREVTRSKAAAHAALRGEMDAIVWTAKALAFDVTGADTAFRLPRRQHDLNFVITARGFANEAAPLASSFVAHGLPETFIADLLAAVTRFEVSLVAHRQARETVAVARAGVASSMQTAFDHLKRLDAIVKNRVRHDAGMATAWRMARRISPPRTTVDRIVRRPTPTGTLWPPAVTRLLPAALVRRE